MSKLTGNNTYFEDFSVGQRIKHARGTTIDEIENQMLSKVVMNTAQGHWNEHAGLNGPTKGRIVFGFITASMVIGLATQDTAENAIKELGLTNIRFKRPVAHGDTVYAYTEVLSTEPAERGGIVRFKHWGVNQDDKVVFEGERIVHLKGRDEA
ncbi:MAG: MaoC family dehydratase [Pseudomonadota bacterium]